MSFSASNPGPRAANRQRMRAAIIAAAAEILAESGPAALTTRRLGAAVGATTRILYSHFDGMPDVIAAVYAHGFDKLAEVLEAAVTNARAGNALLSVAAAYRGFANDHRALFDIMYGGRVRDLLPSRLDRAASRRSLEALMLAVSNDQGADAAEMRARAIWAAIHGVVALEASGWFDADEAEMRLAKAIGADRFMGLR